jgi:hypothetical protein
MGSNQKFYLKSLDPIAFYNINISRLIHLGLDWTTNIYESDIIYNKSAADSCFKLINATLHSGGINVPHHNEYCIESLGLHDINDLKIEKIEINIKEL